MQERYAIPGYSLYALHRLRGGGWEVIGAHGDPKRPSPHSEDGRPTFKLHSDDGRDDTVQLGRIVLLAFAGPPPSAARNFACHRDGDPFNNDPSNLYWGTRSDNARDAVRHGTHGGFRPGIAHPNARISDDVIAAIRAEHRPHGKGRVRGWKVGDPPAEGTIAALASKYGLSPQHVGKIVRGERRR